MTKKKVKLTTFGKIWRATICILAPLGGGFLISMLTRDAFSQFGGFNQPPLSPPAWLFPVAWTILYVLMGVASYLICIGLVRGRGSVRSTKNSASSTMARTALWLYGAQLVLNFLWTPVFFNAGLYWSAFAILVTMWFLEIAVMILTLKVSRPAFWCLLPYLLWTTFAGYLNVGVAVLN